MRVNFRTRLSQPHSEFFSLWCQSLHRWGFSGHSSNLWQRHLLDTTQKCYVQLLVGIVRATGKRLFLASVRLVGKHWRRFQALGSIEPLDLAFGKQVSLLVGFFVFPDAFVR